VTRWRFAAATDTGLVRESNQDSLYVDWSLAVVADGMGGHAAGEVAAEIAADVVHQGFAEDSTVVGLTAAVQRANRAIQADAAANPDRLGMGTTVIALALAHDDTGVIFPVLANVGDSRAYQLRDGALRQLSQDHSVAEEWVRMGRLTPEEALTHPRRHQLTRVLGADDHVEIDLQSVDAKAGDRILLCSDGLSNELSNDRLAEIAATDEPLEAIVENLVAEAREAGGRDNITAVIVEFDEVTSAPVHFTRTVGDDRPVAQHVSAGATRPRRARRITWRVVAGLLVVGAVAAGALAIMHWYAYSTYYLSEDATGYIAVYQGQPPNGVFWYHPVLVTDTQYKVSEVLPGDLASLQADAITEPTLDAALTAAANLHSNWVGSQPIQPTTTIPGQG
jgi:serine/threonine protein phosphatase PrpC